MKKKIFLIMGMVLIVVGLVFGVINIKKYELKKDVQQFLLEQGYEMRDIKSITVYFGRLPFYSAKVVFADETNVAYFYLRDDNVIKQFSTPLVDGNRNYDINSMQFKHLDEGNN